MNTTRRTIACLALMVMAMMVAGLASAVGRSRLVGIVLDPDGKPIEGVTVTATSPELPDFKEIRTTDKKGAFKIDFRTIYVVYRYRFEKVGYQTTEAEQKWELEGTTRHEFTMTPGETPTVTAAAAASTSDQAILAFNTGVAAFANKDYAGAAAKFQEALKHDPELRQAWAALSVVLVEQKQYQQAAEAAERAIALGATDQAVLRSRWEAYRNLGDEAKAAEALDLLERAGQRAEEAKRIYNEGVALAKAGDDQGAFARFQEAALLDPNLEVAQVRLATTALKIGRDAEAAAAAEKILEKDPHDGQALRIRYNACLKLGNEEKLVEAMLGLAEVDVATAREGLWVLAVAADDAQDAAKAKLRLGQVLQVDPNHARSHYLLALINVNEGAKDEAKGHLERFLELAPDDPDAETARELLAYLSRS